MTQNGSKIDSGMARNSSDSLGMNFKSIPLPGQRNNFFELKKVLLIQNMFFDLKK